MSKRIVLNLIIVMSLVLTLSCKKKNTEPEIPYHTVANPTFTPDAGTYTVAQEVSIHCQTSGAVIHYTLNGDDPDENSPIFTAPLPIAVTTVIKARSYFEDYTPSGIVSKNYTITPATVSNMIYVQGGLFNMGNTHGDNNYDLPVHQVTLSSFYIDKYELTQAEWQVYMTFNTFNAHGIADDYPVYNVKWSEALIYCNKRSISEGLVPCYAVYGDTNPNTWGSIENSSVITCNWNANGYRLPTEAEWEFAARGGVLSQNTMYSGSNSLSLVAWYVENSDNSVHTVGTKMANELGIYDMSGNVKEWCWDYYADYTTEAQVNPKGPSSGVNKVNRGGCYGFTDYYHHTVYHRYDDDMHVYSHTTGLRLARTILN